MLLTLGAEAQDLKHPDQLVADHKMVLTQDQILRSQDKDKNN